MQNTFNPAGTCFDSTAFQAMLGENPPDDLLIVHGLVISDNKDFLGVTAAHAWLEFNINGIDCVYDAITGFKYKKEQYYEKLKIEYTIKYTKEEFWKKWKETDFPGPWDKKIHDYTIEGKKSTST